MIKINNKRLALFLPISLFLNYAHAQITKDSILIENNYRSFYYNTPTRPLRKPNLVFVLHGSGGNGRDMMRSAVAMDSVARTNNTLVVYPSAYKNYWNECRKASPAQANVEDVDEQAFFDGMIQRLKKRYDVDTKRVFAVGTSGGGHMTYKLAMTMPDAFRAITAIIANLPDSTNFDCVATGQPVAIMIINGTQDPINPYNGGPVILGKNMNMGNVLSTDRTLAYWADLAQYKGQPTLEKLPDTDPTDGRTIERYTYHASGKPDVVLLKVIGGKHDYPKDIDVHLEALRFFQKQ
ncbi:prolyl oligopeptidase family serine peptidase [Fibrella sp. HMF5335]|uniref:Prolyl oligopeptidase family serine peptidase n=1 Tax=Fibrella rubiginis TaxID=2817060 RepID=A0A939K4Z8_9BACT|nr:PHB depolymerase family esterase [Fibrella rubiginis]MBO0936731.1 prolyl oligopeptidase family serine peptidase [Fibrella rubiginis]